MRLRHAGHRVFANVAVPGLLNCTYHPIAGHIGCASCGRKGLSGRKGAGNRRPILRKTLIFHVVRHRTTRITGRYGQNIQPLATRRDFSLFWNVYFPDLLIHYDWCRRPDARYAPVWAVPGRPGTPRCTAEYCRPRERFGGCPDVYGAGWARAEFRERARARSFSIRRAVASSGCSRSSTTLSRVRRPACVETFTAAMTRPSASWIGAATERRPSSSSWSTRAQPWVLILRSSRRNAAGFVIVWPVRPRRLVSSRYASSRSSGWAASMTRPIDVAYAGNRVPTLIVTVMIRLVGTRAM